MEKNISRYIQQEDIHEEMLEHLIGRDKNYSDSLISILACIWRDSSKPEGALYRTIVIDTVYKNQLANRLNLSLKTIQNSIVILNKKTGDLRRIKKSEYKLTKHLGLSPEIGKGEIAVIKFIIIPK